MSDKNFQAIFDRLVSSIRHEVNANADDAQEFQDRARDALKDFAELVVKNNPNYRSKQAVPVLDELFDLAIEKTLSRSFNPRSRCSK